MLFLRPVLVGFAASALIISAALAQLEDDEFSDEFSLDEFDAELEAESSALDEFLQGEQDSFEALLDKEWREFERQAGLNRYDETKPDELPQKPEPSPQAEPPLRRELAPVASRRPALDELSVEVDNLPIRFSLWQQEFQFPLASALIAAAERVPLPVRPPSVRQFWGETSRLEGLESVLARVAHYRQRHRLNDWGELVLLYQYGLAAGLSPGSNEVLAWRLALASGYDVRLTLSSGLPRLLVSSRQSIYNTSFLRIDGKRYYAVRLSDSHGELGARVQTYPSPPSDLYTPVDMRIAAPPRLASANPDEPDESRALEFTFDNTNYRIIVPTPGAHRDFLSFYPQIEFAVVIGAAPNAATRQSLVDQLRPVVAERDLLDALNLLLRFVQTAFVYEVDDLQFGEENFLFAEETLAYPASDCEDRVALFALLAHDLLGVEVVALQWENHLAAAASLPQTMVGRANFIYKNEPFIVTDPTYINADAGAVMPNFVGIEPKIIPLF